VTAESLASRIQGGRSFCSGVWRRSSVVSTEVREGDLILTLGAGSVSQLAPQILAALETSILKSRLNMVRFPCFLVSLNEGIMLAKMTVKNSSPSPKRSQPALAASSTSTSARTGFNRPASIAAQPRGRGTRAARPDGHRRAGCRAASSGHAKLRDRDVSSLPKIGARPARRIRYQHNCLRLLFASGGLAWLRQHGAKAAQSLSSLAPPPRTHAGSQLSKFRLSPADRIELLGDYLPYCETIKLWRNA